jgi:hypothetical protein
LEFLRLNSIRKSSLLNLTLAKTRFPVALTVLYIAVFSFVSLRFGWNRATTGGLFVLALLVTPAFWLFVRANRKPSTQWTGGNIIIVAAAFIAIAAPAAYFWNQGQLIPDEGTYLFQARMYEQYQWDIPSPGFPNAAGEGTDHELRTASDFIHTIHHQGRWFGKYPPGWPLVLAAAGAIRAGWIVNVAFGALMICLAMWIGRDIYSARCGFLAGLLLAASPFFFFTAMGRMAHMWCALLVAGALLFTLRAARTNDWAPYLGMLCLIVGAIQVRPYTGAVTGAVMAGYLLWSSRSSTRLLAARAGVGLAAGLLAAGLMAVYNRQVTGSYWLTPYALYNAGALLPAELAATPSILIDNLLRRFRWSLEAEILFTGPYLLAPAIYAVYRDRFRPPTIFLALLALSLLLAHLPTTMPPGGQWGDRFHSETLIAYMLVCARGVELAAGDLRNPPMRALLACCVLIQLTHLACTYAEFFQDTRPVAKWREADIQTPATRDIAFIAVEGRTRTGTLPAHWNPQSPGWQTAPRIYLIDPGPQARPRLAAALGRRNWVVFTYQARTGDVRIEAGQCCPAP